MVSKIFFELGRSIIGTTAETYSSASPDQLKNAKIQLSNLINNNFDGKVVFVIGENGFDLAKNCALKIPIIKVGNLDSIRTFQDVRDAVEAYYKLIIDAVYVFKSKLNF